jgi:hypothetical protein
MRKGSAFVRQAVEVGAISARRVAVTSGVAKGDVIARPASGGL